jgi:multidrug efflux pump subunit AcrA (membrane-fusion protein)
MTGFPIKSAAGGLNQQRIIRQNIKKEIKMKKIIIIFIIVIVIIFIAYRAYDSYKAKKEAMNQPVPEKIIPVKTTLPIHSKITEKIKASGNIQSESEITLYSKVNGKIAKNLVKLGSYVKPGDVLTIINRDEIGYEFNPYEVKSDVKGVVSKVLQNPGAAVNSNIPLINLVDIDIVKAVAAVDEMKIRFVKIGQSALVRVQAYPGETFKAKVTNISPVCNQSNRTIDIEVSINNNNHRLKPGMYAEVELIESIRTSLILPISSIVDRAGQKYVFSIDNGFANQIPVVVGSVLGDSAEVISGIKLNDTIISTGADKLNNKDKVTVIK